LSRKKRVIYCESAPGFTGILKIVVYLMTLAMFSGMGEDVRTIFKRYPARWVGDLERKLGLVEEAKGEAGR